MIVATVDARACRRAAAGINVQLALELPRGRLGRAASSIFRDGVRLRLVASRADGPGIEARVVEAGRLRARRAGHARLGLRLIP